jgi:Kef-type K+ transport system membrane component KefB
MTSLAMVWEWFHSLPSLAKFALGMAIIVGIPPLSRRARLPAVVGLLLSGVVLGPHVLGFFGEHAPIADFFAELGKLLLMFFAGLEIDIAQFRRERNKSMVFGLVTTLIPLLLGTAVGLLFGYQPIAAIVLGSLLASHTLLAAPIIVRWGETRLEPVSITFGATVISDTLSLIVFAICVPIYQSGFSVSGLVVQLIEIAIFVPLILFGLSRLGAHLLKKVEHDEDAYFIMMLAIVAVAGLLAQIINLPGIVGAFLAGLAGQRGGARQAGQRKIGILRKFLFYPNLLYRDRVPDRPGRILSEHHYQFSLGDRGHRRAAHRQVDSSTNGGSRLRLFSGRAHDDVVPHLAAGGGDTCGHVSRL